MGDIKANQSLSPTLCRCCLSEMSCRDITSEYFWNGKREVYTDMLRYTFGLNLSIPQNCILTICEKCISRIRDATEFKLQVQKCEKSFEKQLPPSASNSPKDEVYLKLQKLKSEKIEIDEFVDGSVTFEEDDKFYPLLSEKCSSSEESSTINPKIELSVDREINVVMKKPTLINKSSTNKNVLVLRKMNNKIPTSSNNFKAVKIGSKLAYVRIKPSNEEVASKIRKVTLVPKIPLDSKNSMLKKGVNKVNVKKEKEPQISLSTKNALIKQNGVQIMLYSTAYPFRLPKPYHRLACIYCKQQNIEPTDFGDHMNEKHTKKFDPANTYRDAKTDQVKVDCSDLRCRICNKTFDTIDGVAKHLKEDHNKKYIDLSLDLGLIPFKFKKNDILTCAICPKQFMSVIMLSKHTSLHFSKFTCDKCGKAYGNTQSLRNHQVYGHVGKPVCFHCKSTFETREELHAHHENSFKCRNFLCSKCGERFVKKVQLRDHQESVHGVPKKVIECTACKEKFTLRTHFDKHFIKVHSTSCPKCQVCNKKFTTEFRLSEHMPIHTGATPYECEQCSKTYRTQKALKQHVRINHNHHFSCDECNKHFGCKSALLNHNATHHV